MKPDNGQQPENGSYIDSEENEEEKETDLQYVEPEKGNFQGKDQEIKIDADSQEVLFLSL